MNPEDLRSEIDRAGSHMADYQRERISHDGLHGNRVADTKAGDRNRNALRKVETALLDDIQTLAEGVKAINHQLGRAARQAAQIEEANHALVRPESRSAMLSSLNEAEAVVTELSSLRSATLKLIAGLASRLTPTDGRTAWTDVRRKGDFGSDLDLFPDPEPDLVDELIGQVDETRDRAARRQSPNVADDELARILGG